MRSSRVPRASRAKSFLFWSAAGGVLAPTLLGWLGAWVWWLGLLEHFRVQLAVAALAVTLVAALVRRFLPAAAASLALVLNLAAIAPTWISVEAPAHQSKPLRLLVLNVQQDGRDHARVARWLAKSDADVIGLLEVDRPWLRDLAPALAPWKYRLEQPHANDKFGLALYSRRPFVFREVRTFGVPWPPAIVARLEMDGVPVTLVLVHPPPPVTGELAAVQRRFLDALADARPSLGEHVVVMGDFNATPWSHALRRLRARTGLVDPRGFGLFASWPTGNPLLGIPIDHVLLSKRLYARSRERGPDVGSDHFPLLAEIALVR
jgi:endonuclease/exonuclease/phosphatase (EEP) superfamily protein YafD